MFSNYIRPSLGRVSRSIHASNAASKHKCLLSTLAILEQRDGQLNKASLSAVTAATKLGAPIHAFIAGTDASKVAQEAAQVLGVDKVVTVSNAAYEKVLALHHRCKTCMRFYLNY